MTKERLPHRAKDEGPGDHDAGDLQLITDADEVGLSTTLLFAAPLFRVLVQAVAESTGDSAHLRAWHVSGAWVRVSRRFDEQVLLVATGHGPVGRAQPDEHEALAEHGFANSATDGYVRRFSFETDEAFMDIAVLVIGTLQHAWGASLRDAVGVELIISLPPTWPELPGQVSPDA